MVYDKSQYAAYPDAGSFVVINNSYLNQKTTIYKNTNLL
ncbi:1,3-beta-galactosyl-N-acetylhexosamine phosphorylase C-terminal domain-containing protein [Evansella vedderi]